MFNQGNLLDLDCREYSDVWDLQRKLVDSRSRKEIPDTLLLVQHPHVFTVGKAVPGDLPAEISGVSVLRTERGGKWTYHGPGQLVGYPILDLDARNRDIHAFLRNIEETIILTMAKFDINAERHQGKTGVWIRDKKIASIGAAIRKWITFHGFALNVNTDLSYFGFIEPCGMPSSTITSMQAILNHEVDLGLVKKEIRSNFESVFELHLSEVNSEEMATLAVSS
jgi:lipoate-protein ligase B